MWRTDSETALWKSYCVPLQHKHWLWNFLRVVWGVEWNRQGLGKWLYEPVHKPYCDWLQSHLDSWLLERKMADAGQRHVMSILPRGAAKTLIASKCLTAAVQLADADMTCYIGSETTKKAQDFLAAVRNVLDGEDGKAWFTRLYGGSWASPDRRWSEVEL